MALRNSLAPLLQSGAIALTDVAPAPTLEGLLGHAFRDQAFLQSALTHGSHEAGARDYQRLEFLGDRVLSLVIADALYHRYPAEKEGPLAARLSLLVRAETCARVGEHLGLESSIILGRVEKRNGVQRMTSVLGDVVEALIGALYLDGGMEVARGFILKQWQPMLEAEPSSLKDAKTFVQEWALGRALPLPHYEILKREGLQHVPVFTVGLTVGSSTPAQGQGASKQLAEMAAAQAFIAREGLR
jgi:ribonuclease-3